MTRCTDETMSLSDAEPSETEAAAARPARRARLSAAPRLSRRRRTSSRSTPPACAGSTSSGPGSLERDLARGALRLPRPRPRGRPLPQPAAEDRRLRRLPLHRPPLPGLRPRRRPARHRRARPLRRPRLRGHDPEPAAAAGRVPVRALPRQGGAARAALLARLRLPALPPRRRQLRLLLPDAAQDRQQARRARGRDLRRAAPRRSCATSPTSSRRSSTSAR